MLDILFQFLKSGLFKKLSAAVVILVIGVLIIRVSTSLSSFSVGQRFCSNNHQNGVDEDDG